MKEVSSGVISYSREFELGSDVIIANIGNLAPGESQSFSITVQTLKYDPSGLDNKATASAENAESMSVELNTWMDKGKNLTSS